MPLRFRYTITDMGREYLSSLDSEAPNFDFKTWIQLAPEAVILEALERLFPEPALIRQILLAIPEESRWPKEILVSKVHKLVSKGYVDFEGEVHPMD